MDDREFFDLLYQGWTKTTGAENTFWLQEDRTSGGVPWFGIYSVDQKQDKKYVGGFSSEDDAAFVTAVHGCFGDLIHRLHNALDEADRLDERADERENEVAELAIRVMELEQELEDAR